MTRLLTLVHEHSCTAVNQRLLPVKPHIADVRAAWQVHDSTCQSALPLTTD